MIQACKVKPIRENVNFIQNTMFEGLKVIELASVLAGPSVGQFFAELGAEVIKVENVENGGDVTRSWLLTNESGTNRSAYFCSVNWGKKTIHVNLKHQEHRNKLYHLVSNADVVITSFKHGDADRLGVSYEDLRKLNAKIIYGKITGFGDDDPRVGYDAVIQAEAGFMKMNGEKNGDPLKMPVALMDILAAHHLKEAILLALIHRMKTGKGSEVSISLIDAALASLANQATNYLIGGVIPEAQGSAHPNIAPYGDIFRSREGISFVLAVGSDGQFEKLCEILEIDLCQEKAFVTNKGRVQNRESLKVELDEIFKKFSYKDIEARLLKNHIPFGRIRNMQEVVESPYSQRMLISSEGLKSFRNNAFKLCFFDPPKLSAPPDLPDLQ